jgi:3-hydroxy-9,10-secoandrosta-1,3,5(10)-triene-9,17-dione monooxygenase reductase component
MSIDPMKYRQVLGHFPTGVTVITGINEGKPIGFTIGSFASVSIDPPLVGFLPMITSDRWQEILRTKSFCVNVLGHDQAELCWQFSKGSIEDPFEGVAWTHAPVTGSPMIDGAIAWMDCTIEGVVDAGDHHFVMGRIEDFEHAGPDTDPQPLLFYKGKLGGFAPL